MRLLNLEYYSVHGTVHCFFFGKWIGSAFDFPLAAKNNLSEWREGQPVFATIAGSRNCEALA